MTLRCTIASLDGAFFDEILFILTYINGNIFAFPIMAQYLLKWIGL